MILRILIFVTSRKLIDTRSGLKASGGLFCLYIHSHLFSISHYFMNFTLLLICIVGAS
jgi:hypothetical protein